MLEREKMLDKVEFADFLLKYEERLREVAELLSKPFEDSIRGLELQISALSAKMEFVSWCYAYAEGFLTNARFKTLPPKRKDITDMDRNKQVDYSTQDEQRVRDWLERMTKDISNYLDKAQSVLSTRRVELDKLGYGGQE